MLQVSRSSSHFKVADISASILFGMGPGLGEGGKALMTAQRDSENMSFTMASPGVANVFSSKKYELIPHQP